MILLPLILYLFAFRNAGIEYLILYRWLNIILIIWAGLLLVYSIVKIIHRIESILIEKYITIYNRYHDRQPLLFDILTEIILKA